MQPPQDERCPLNPSLRRVECSHCQGPPRGTFQNPTFSLKEDVYDGFPIVEVLKNGGPVHPWDQHFRFGRRKAEILVACMKVLREFWFANDAQRRLFVPQVIQDDARRLRVQVYVEMHMDFELSTGPTVDRPWLHLKGLPPDSGTIGLGASKCQAICALEKELREWLLK